MKSRPNPALETRANQRASQLPSTSDPFWVEIRLTSGECIGYVQSDLGDFTETLPTNGQNAPQMGHK
jgi:hypothetical protein